jgi:endoglucanase
MPCLPGAASLPRRPLLALLAALAAVVAMAVAPAALSAPGDGAITKTFTPARRVTVEFWYRESARGPHPLVRFRANRAAIVDDGRGGLSVAASGRRARVGRPAGGGSWRHARVLLDARADRLAVAIGRRQAQLTVPTAPETGVEVGDPGRVRVQGARVTVADGGGALAGARLWIDPESDAARQAGLWRTSRPADAALLDRIAAQPQAEWLGDWTPDPRAAAAGIVDRAAADGGVPVLVAYDIPDRDCGQHSAGGAPDAAAYRDWIDGLATGIGARRAMVILEPDALAAMDCLSPAARRERVGLLAWATARLARQPGTLVYLDAGNARWIPAREMARRLRAAGIGAARGFALNVANHVATDESEAYGRAISALVGGRPFVIDTGRNGAGTDGAWCNAPARALGPAPTLRTGDPLVDALLWVKPPGASDGECNGGPPAGAWWPEAAIDLARRAI